MLVEVISPENESASISIFNLKEGERLRPWSFVAAHAYLSSRAISSDVCDRWNVIAVMTDGNLFYAYQEIATGEVWTAQIISDGTVNYVETHATLRDALEWMANIVATDHE